MFEKYVGDIFGGSKPDRLPELKHIESEYGNKRVALQKQCEDLFELRQSIAADIIEPTDKFLSALFAEPVELKKAVGKLKVDYLEFAKVFEMQQGYQDNLNKNVANGIKVGVGMGASIATLAPTAAMAVATTFGITAGGTAIGVLSGAAATNAALAWLGGGAIAAGGGGMAAGSALLAMAGPVGWGVAGLTILSGVAWQEYNDRERLQKIQEAIQKYQYEFGVLIGVENSVRRLYGDMKNCAENTKQQLKWLAINVDLANSGTSNEYYEKMGIFAAGINQLINLLNERI